MPATLTLLGVARRLTPDGELALPPGLGVQLAAYLAVRGDWVPRDELVGLLWPEEEARRGRHNLSQLLYATRRTAWGHDVEAEPRRVRWRVESDVGSFRRAVAEGDWAHAIACYGGELLEGLDHAPSAAYENWLVAEREDLRSSWRETMQAHAAEHTDAGRWSEGATLYRALLRHDDLLEDAVQALMRCEAAVGRRDAALQVYTRFRSRLDEELGLEPLEVTAELATRIRSGAVGPEPAPSDARPTAGTRSAAGGSADDDGGASRDRHHAGGAAAAPDRTGAADRAPADAHPGTPDPTDTHPGTPDPTDPEARDVRPGPVRNLGNEATPFVGRSLELAELHALLARPQVRALTILGAGGTGKTRIGQRLARERAGHHEDGAIWIALAASADDAGALEAIVRGAGLTCDPEPDALAEALAERHLLLVLDNVEHLPGTPALVHGLLDRCPGLQLLVTSRAALDVPGEVVYPLHGLGVPPRDDAADAEAYDAVGLFLRNAHRVRPTFHPEGDERIAVVTLARTLGGSPLALELAAGWMRVLQPTELLQEVRRDLDVLADGREDLPPRHRSLRAVFESSWTLLADGERDALRRLGVFRGGVTRDTAKGVADVGMNTLLALVNRALLQREGGNRFVAHPVVDQFVRAKLDERPELRTELEGRHGAFFQALAEDADRRLDGAGQRDALRQLDLEYGNLAAAFERHAQGGRYRDAAAIAVALGRYWRWRGRAREALPWFDRLRTLPAPEQPESMRVRAALAEGLLLQGLGRYDDAAAAFAGALAEAHALEDAGLVAAALVDEAILAWRRGDLEAARGRLDRAAALYRERGDDARLTGTLNNLGNLLRDGGDPHGALAVYDESLALGEGLGNAWEMANTLNNKAVAFAYLDDLESARAHFARALALQRSIDNAPGIAMSLINLGNVHLDTGAWDEARALYDEALALCREVDDRDGVAHLHTNLAILAQWQGDYERAHEGYCEAMRIRHELGARAKVAQSLACLVDLAAAQGAFERALVLAGAAIARIEAVGVPLTPPQQATLNEALSKARTAVGAARAAQLERRGASLPEREALGYARQERALP